MAVIESKYIDNGVYGFTNPFTGTTTNSYGYNSGVSQGDVSDTADGSTNDDVSGLFSGADLYDCQWSEFNFFSFRVTGNRSNSGFDSVEVGGTTFNRTDASHSYSSTTNLTQWSWSTTSNPFGTTSGTNVLVEWDDGTTSSTPTIDSVSVSSSTVNEGSSVTFTVSVSNYANGNKTFSWSINNITTSAADFDNSTTSGNVVINSSGGSGSNTVTITTVADSTTEGNQTFTLTVDDPTSSATATSTTVTIVDTSQTPSTPVISSVSQNNPASTTVTTTVNLSTSTTGIEYAQSTTNSVPSTGWQTSNQFTQTRNTTRYYWASTNRNTSGFSTGFSKAVGYFTGDPSVDAPSLSPSSPIDASYSGNVAATITGGTSGTVYRVKNTTTGEGCGNTGDGNGTIQIGSVRESDLPDPGETDNYEVQYKVTTANGGNDSWASVSPARTFSISRTAAVCPTTNTTHTITGVTSGSSQTLSQTSKVTSGNNLTISLTTPHSASTSFPSGPGQNKSEVSASITSGGGSRSVSHSGTNATITYTPPYRTTQGTAVLSITHIEYVSFADDPQSGTFTWNIAYTDTITLTVTICPQTQTLVDITSVDSVTPNENTTDQVTATVTTPGGVTVSSYAWSTTGNITLSSSTVQSPVLSFGNVTADSSASVSVTVTDSNNNTATDTQNYTIQFVNQSPVAIIQGPSSTDVDSAVTYSGSDSYDPDGQSLQYQWSASNGGETFTQSKSTNSSFSFTPTETGSYTVTLTAYDSLNSTNVTTKSLLSTSTDTENTDSAGGFGFEIYAANGDTILRADELLIRKAPAVTLDSSGDASTSISGTESQTTILGIQGTNTESALSLSTSGTTTKSVSLSGGAANTRVSLFLLR